MKGAVLNIKECGTEDPTDSCTNIDGHQGFLHVLLIFLDITTELWDKVREERKVRSSVLCPDVPPNTVTGAGALWESPKELRP